MTADDAALERRKTAEAIATAYVAEVARTLGVELVILADQTIEFSTGWVFFYQSRSYIDRGAISDAIVGNAPLIISKRDGAVHVTGTALPIEDYIHEFERRQGNRGAV